MAKEDLNKYIKKSHIKALEKFKTELDAFRQETGEEVVTLYEDAFTSFTLDNIRLVDGCLCYDYDGNPEKDRIVRKDVVNTGKMILTVSWIWLSSGANA